VTEPLAGFIRALRAQDVRVSPAEAIDAHRALAEVGWADRALVRDVLAATLAKSAAEAARFDACFDLYFAREALAAHPDQGVRAAGPGLEALVVAGDQAGLAQAMEAAADRAGAADIHIPTQRGLVVRRTLDQMGLRGLEARIAALRAAGDVERAERLAEGRAELFERANAFVDRQAALYASETGRRLREQILARQAFAAIDEADVKAMQTLVRRMARRLAERYARRRRRARKGRLDVRHTVRRSLGYGGAPFELIWKHEKIDRPQIVVACDVSRSVASAAQFLLLFLHSLGEAVERLEAFAFSDRLVRVDDLLDEARVQDSTALILERIGFRPTDYGRALEDLVAQARLDRRTTVIILGDARSNYADPRLDLMRRLADQTRQVVWLNPEPTTYWGQGDSRMDVYARFCRVATSCNTLEGLERVIDGVLRAPAPR
jgi:uncharacterized protein with von Willebrand factor type A (vWA) domain